MTDVTSIVVVTCAKCGKKYTRRTWERLEFVGIQLDGDNGALELRNCPCGSTRSLPTELGIPVLTALVNAMAKRVRDLTTRLVAYAEYERACDEDVENLTEEDGRKVAMRLGIDVTAWAKDLQAKLTLVARVDREATKRERDRCACLTRQFARSRYNKSRSRDGGPTAGARALLEARLAEEIAKEIEGEK